MNKDVESTISRAAHQLSAATYPVIRAEVAAFAASLKAEGKSQSEIIAAVSTFRPS